MKLLERTGLHEQLREYSAGATGAGSLVYIEGDAGAGKTALVETFKEELEPAHRLLADGGGDARQIVESMPSFARDANQNHESRKANGAALEGAAGRP